MEHRSQAESALGGAAYGMLFVLGVVMAVVGGFTHPTWQWGVVPASAVVWVLALFGVCLGAGKLMRARLGAMATALGWLLVTMPFTLELGMGDLVIASGPSGYVYLYGGLAGLVVAYLMSPSSQGGSWLLRGYPSEKTDVEA
ncbi:DUF6113 family protein [Nonomuraea gerenzanensis]|uniref:Integral membrane protein n=1 Tax=Nonomuraea gerenzanensis TaxID=93944 RepID=A0A1M4EPN7_9ACTN|nr:DUF6113 family protein [Nonomuraea gerenzanensis]UBU12252.1 DUF6113 family protein [Nonomuraea gerenzanensis]SBP00787.1 hypothetical protein BN4615_P10303 [Nonomuraea gerenzanensis]